MKSWKFKILLPLILVSLLLGTYYALWHYPVSSGKRVGNLVKISKKGKLFPTWEGTIDEGSGEQLTSYFSVRSKEIANELYNYEGKEVVLYYDQYILGWPWDTNYNITIWKAKVSEMVKATSQSFDEKMIDYVGKTLFCALLGSLYKDKELYEKVKEYIRINNLFLFKQIKTCNE